MATGLFTLKQVNQAISQGAWSGYIAPKWVEYLVVAGGGGGGAGTANSNGAGAGAGGLLTGIVTVAAGTSYTVTVGGGGTGGSLPSVNGNNSVFGAITSLGGGYGAYGGSYTTGGSGGSGGGGAGYAGSVNVGGSATSGQGNSGGIGYGVGLGGSGGGGGGGAGTVGLNALTSGTAGNGGAGIASAISGAVTTYAGGGGAGSGGGNVLGTGGVGGGGSGTAGGAGKNGAANTGGGGGGANGVFDGGTGGSGIVVVRYPGNVQFYTGGAITYVNGYIVHIFYASGTLAPTTPTVVTADYQISRSLRFNQPDSAYLIRTATSAGNRRKWTFSAWIKRAYIGDQKIFSAGTGTTDTTYFQMFIGVNDNLRVSNYNSDLITTTGISLYRDYSAWYHIVLAADTDNATATNRLQLYVNGSLVTTGNVTGDTAVNSIDAFNIGRNGLSGGSGYFGGYMTEINLIDGQALTPSSFGATNANTGVWGPKAYTGSYGTNGFYLNFSDNSNTTAATLGKDYSGNGNNFTPNNFSVTAGAGNDSLVDVPTNYGTDYGVGGAVRGNYCTFNPLVKVSFNPTLTNGNLDLSAISQWSDTIGTIGVNSGKWYWEVVSGNTDAFVGICGSNADLTTSNPQNNTGTISYYGGSGQKYVDGTASAYGATYTTETIGVALDIDGGTVTFYKSNTSQGSISLSSSTLNGKTIFPFFVKYASTMTVNFGQRAWAYTPPGGFKALVTQNLPTPTIGSSPTTLATKYFNPVLYTGTGASLNVTGVGFQPDFVWVKGRSGATDHALYDAVRGVQKQLESNTTTAETTETTGLTAFGSDGFTTGALAQMNTSAATYVAWNWIASNAAGVSNTSGSVTSTVSVNTTSGFSVVTWTGTSFGYTVGHGLSVAPAMVIVKNRSSAGSWWVYHQSLSSGYGLNLETTGAQQASIWGSVTSTTFPIGSNVYSGGTTNYVAYCFAAIAGYSAFGSYVGNGSADGVFVYTGFRPAYVLNKSTSAGNGWNIHDDARSPNNVASQTLFANATTAEGGIEIDILSNGFKARDTSANVNGNGVTYIFAAFAETPFKYSLAR